MATAKKTTTKAAPRKATTTGPATPRAAAKTTIKVEPIKTRQGRSPVLGQIDLGAIDVKTLASDYAYATVGAGDRAVEMARELPTTFENLRNKRAQRTSDLINDNRQRAESLLKDAPVKAQSLLKDAPVKAQSLLKDVPTKLQSEMDENLDAVRKEYDSYVARGRKVVESIANARSTKRAMSQTETARRQVKGAVTSIRKAVEQGQEAVEGAVGRIGVRR